jgi:tetratricopeptide (TPR) repeat protein
MLVFSWRVPTWAALKASYLLPLSLPFACFLCRALEPLARRVRAALLALLGATALVAAAVAASGLVLPARPDSPATAAVHYYFAEYDRARAVLAGLAGDAPSPLLLDASAAVELADGRADRAVELYARAGALAGRPEAPRLQSLAVARALAGNLGGALASLDVLLARSPSGDLLANRGAVRAAAGDLGGAERDLAAAVAAAPELGIAWWSLAAVRERRGGPTAARETWARAARAACTPPGRPAAPTGAAGFTFGQGLLLLFDGEGLRPALPAVRRGACAALGERAQERHDG